MSQLESSIPLTDAIPFAPKPAYQRKEVDERLEKPHYLFTAINLIEARMIREHRESPELRAGGMLISSPCLRHVGGFVRRGLITPLLENVYDPVAREEADGSDQKGSYLELPPVQVNGMPVQNPLKTRLAKPGAHLPLLLSSSSNLRGGIPKGLVEIRDLRYTDYDPVEMDQVQRALFPTWPKLPVRIHDFRDMLSTTRHALTASSYLMGICENALESCEQAEQYMTRVIDQIHFEMKHSTGQNGRVPQYTGLHLVFLEQLGLAPQARELQEIARKTSASPDVMEMFQLFREASTEDRDAFLTAMKEMMQPRAAEPEKETVIANETASVDEEKKEDRPANRKPRNQG